jgi:hypothetical protein
MPPDEQIDRSLRMRFAINAVLLIAFICAVSYAYHQSALRWAARRQRGKLLAELMALPPVKMDFSTPEGSILCLEDAYRRRDVEAAVACRDFATEAKVWLRERGNLNKQRQAEMMPEVTGTMEKSCRNGMAKNCAVDWERAKSYFPNREPYGDGVVAVSEVTHTPDGNLWQQRILVTETAKGWRVVMCLPAYQNGAD